MVTGAYDPALGTCFTISRMMSGLPDESKNLWMVAALPFVHDSAVIEPGELHEAGRTKSRLNYLFHFRICFCHGDVFPEFFDVRMPDSCVELRQHIL